MSILFDDEKIEFGKTRNISSFNVTDSELENRYASGAVRIVTEQARYPLPTIPAMVESEDYVLNPEFQRRHRWDVQKKSRLIESFIINVPIPPIFLYEVGYAKYEVMDGLQRLTAIDDFYRDRIELSGLEEWPELNGRRYSTLPDQIRRGVDRRYLSSIILLQETAKSETEAQRLKQLVFERINSGGEQLTYQESRNAIYDGPLNRICIKLARNKYLCRTWSIPEPTEQELTTGDVPQNLTENSIYQKMEDVELVLRFFAYRQRIEHQDGPLKTYLDQYLQKGNLFPPNVLIQLTDLFERTIKLVYELYSEKAFWLQRRRRNTWGWYRRPTTVLYDPLMFVASKYLDKSDILTSKRKQLINQTILMYHENYEEFEGRYTNRENLRKRNELFDNLFKKVLDL
jgi:hypothetical protein